MAQGLQCWDGAGRVAVDLSDYAIRFLGATTVTFAIGEQVKYINFLGATRAGSFATIVAGSIGGTAADWATNAYFCRAYDGGFAARYLPTVGGYAITLTVEVYSFQ